MVGVLAIIVLATTWKLGADRLDAWSSEVGAGRIPNFAANLQY